MSNWDEIFEGVVGAVEKAAKSVEQKTYGGTTLGESALSATGAGGHFRFPDVATAKDIIADYEDRLDSFEKRAERIENARGALDGHICQDPETFGFVGDAKGSLDSLQQLNESMIKYTEGYITKLERAIKAMNDIDADTADGLDGKGQDPAR
ncbi:MAG: hypothetical protein ACRDQB_01450 [Thermocrispum sp.]